MVEACQPTHASGIRHCTRIDTSLSIEVPLLHAKRANHRLCMLPCGMYSTQRDESVHFSCAVEGGRLCVQYSYAMLIGYSTSKSSESNKSYVARQHCHAAYFRSRYKMSQNLSSSLSLDNLLSVLSRRTSICMCVPLYCYLLRKR